MCHDRFKYKEDSSDILVNSFLVKKVLPGTSGPRKILALGNFTLFLPLVKKNVPATITTWMLQWCLSFRTSSGYPTGVKTTSLSIR